MRKLLIIFLIGLFVAPAIAGDYVIKNGKVYNLRTHSYHDVRIDRGGKRVRVYNYDTGETKEYRIKRPTNTDPLRSPLSFTNDTYGQDPFESDPFD